MITDQQFDRLPLYARQEIARLRANVQYAESKLAAGPESNTWADPHSTSRPLGTDTTIRFLLHGPTSAIQHRNYVDLRVDRDHKRQPFLYVMGSESLGIEPQSSNTVRVRVVR